MACKFVTLSLVWIFVNVVHIKCQNLDVSYNVESDNGGKAKYFLDQLLTKYGSGAEITRGQFKVMVTQFRHEVTAHDGITHDMAPPSVWDRCNVSAALWAINASCLRDECLNAGEMWQLYGLGDNDTADQAMLAEMAPLVLHQLRNDKCAAAQHDTKHRIKAPEAEVWGFGFLCVTGVVLSGLLGRAFFVGLASPRTYALLLMAMVSLAIGVLTGMGLLFLIPEALNLPHMFGGSTEYVWKLTTVAGGIYFLFLFERVIKIVKHVKQRKANAAPGANGKVNNYQLVPKSNESNATMQTLIRNQSDESCGDGAMPEVVINAPNGIHKPAKEVESEGHEAKGLKSLQKDEIDTVAWVLILGDTMHNFVDGATIGAGFAQSILTGVGLSLCIMCEHVPHKIGDFAILLNAGMSLRQAVGYTLLTGIMNYVGLVVGILVGELTDATTWIIAFAGGIFLYIGLVDMLPEISEEAGKEDSLGDQIKVFVIQNIGILVGYATMILVALYAGNITFE